jgi:hypothetical protein
VDSNTIVLNEFSNCAIRVRAHSLNVPNTKILVDDDGAIIDGILEAMSCPRVPCSILADGDSKP